MFDVLNKISDIGIVPVVKIDNAKDAVPLAKALINGGLPCAEITFRTDAAKEAIKLISDEFPEMLVGAGTVLTEKQADEAVEAGAKFIVSPGLNANVVKHCIEKGYPITPGICSPSEIETAISLGLDTVKFFPAEAAGGLKMIKAMSAPYSSIKFMPTGGINANNLKSYLDFNKILACGGSWMVSSDLINEGKFDEIEALTREAVEKMLGFTLGHIGINTGSENEAKQIAALFKNIFGFKTNETDQAFFADTCIEVMKQKGMGEKGHIAITTNYMNRAVRYLKDNGFCFIEGSEKFDEKGNLRLIYLDLDFGGFKVHLSQK